MSVFKVKQPEEIKRDILQGMSSDLDKREGSFSDDMAGPLALELHKMYEELHKIRPMVWVDETSGPYLDLAADEIGIVPRKEGTPSQVMLEVTGTAGYVLPAGTTFLTAENLLFDTVSEAVIPEEGAVAVLARSRETGAENNVDAGTVTYRYSNDIRVKSVTNPQAAVGGTDRESDASLYGRIVFARQRPATSGNKYHYEMWALEVSGVGKARVFPLWNGPGTVKVLIADQYSQPVDAAVERACAEHIEEQRPTTARVTVASAVERTVNVAARVKLEPGADPDIVLENVRQQYREHFRAQSLEQFTVTYHRMGAMLIAAEGVADYRELRVNGERRDVALTQEEVPVLGEVDLTWI